jgi:THO complex subunit 2
VYSFIVTLSSSETADGVNPEQWLSSLETFAGAFYKKFTDVEIHGLLAYFTKRLNGGHTLELGVLRSLLKMAGGYGFADSESIASLSQVQLDGRCGGLMLKRETSDFGIVEKVNIHSSRRLRAALQHDSCGVTILILLSQLRTRVLFDSSKSTPKQIKLIGNLYDTCQRTLNTLLAFLVDGSEDLRSQKNGGAIACYANSLPTLGQLYEDFGISSPNVWMLCRPLLRAAILMTEDVEQGKKSKSEVPYFLKSFHPSSDEVQKKCRQMVHESCWNHMTPLVYQRFFTYNISDLYCPEERYKTEIVRLDKEVDLLTQLQRGGREADGMRASLAAKAVAAGGTQRDIRQALAFTKEHEIELQRLKDNSGKLSFHMKRQKNHCKSVCDKLQEEKSKFFTGLEGKDGKIMTPSVFFAHCLYPRSLQSAEDAMYCARFIEMLHEMDTPGFHTLQILDSAINAIAGALYSITEDEAGCLGIFFEKIWTVISEWRYDEKKYDSAVSKKVSSNFFFCLIISILVL